MCDKYCPPNYALSENWLARPQKSNFSADAIFLYPTCYKADPGQPLVCGADYLPMREKAALTCPKHTPIFAEIADLYVPFYSQVNAFGTGHLSERQTLELYLDRPLKDCRAALDYYFNNFNDGRPFFLAGHSQGSVMALLVMAEYFKEHPEYYQRLVAAYVIGFGVTGQVLSDYPHLRMAQGAEDYGVIVSYNTEGPGNAGSSSVVVPPGSLLINPLNWRTDSVTAGTEQNLGSLVEDGQGGYTLGAGLADATIDEKRGTLVCTSISPELFASHHLEAFGPESFHNWDYRLYFANLKLNVAQRLAAYWRDH